MTYKQILNLKDFHKNRVQKYLAPAFIYYNEECAGLFKKFPWHSFFLYDERVPYTLEEGMLAVIDMRKFSRKDKLVFLEELYYKKLIYCDYNLSLGKDIECKLHVIGLTMNDTLRRTHSMFLKSKYSQMYVEEQFKSLLKSKNFKFSDENISVLLKKKEYGEEFVAIIDNLPKESIGLDIPLEIIPEYDFIWTKKDEIIETN